MGSRPKTVIFWPFLAFEGRLGGLKDPLEVRVEDETCKTIHGTYFEGILSQKKLDRVGSGAQKPILGSEPENDQVGENLIVSSNLF